MLPRNYFLPAWRRYNAAVFGGRLPADLQITWSKHLLTTAGMTHYKQEAPSCLFGSPRHAIHLENGPFWQ